MKNTLQIGEREYQLPFRYDEKTGRILDAEGENFAAPRAEIKGASVRINNQLFDAVGRLVADALNKSEEGWKVIERDGLPAEGKPYLTTIYDELDKDYYVERCAHRDGVWFICGRDGKEYAPLVSQEKAVAWREISPYIPEGKL